MATRLSGPVEIIRFKSPNGHKVVTLYADIHGETSFCTSCNPPDCLPLVTYLYLQGGTILAELRETNDRPVYPGLLQMLFDFDAAHGNMRVGRLDLRREKDLTIAFRWLQSLPDSSEALNKVYQALTEVVLGNENPLFYHAQLAQWVGHMTNRVWSDKAVEALQTFLQETVEGHDSMAMLRMALETPNVEEAFFPMSVVLAPVVDLNALRLIDQSPDSTINVVCGRKHSDNVARLLVDVMGYREVARTGDRRQQCVRLR